MSAANVSFRSFDFQNFRTAGLSVLILLCRVLLHFRISGSVVSLYGFLFIADFLGMILFSSHFYRGSFNFFYLVLMYFFPCFLSFVCKKFWNNFFHTLELIPRDLVNLPRFPPRCLSANLSGKLSSKKKSSVSFEAHAGRLSTIKYVLYHAIRFPEWSPRYQKSESDRCRALLSIPHTSPKSLITTVWCTTANRPVSYNALLKPLGTTSQCFTTKYRLPACHCHFVLLLFELHLLPSRPENWMRTLLGAFKASNEKLQEFTPRGHKICISLHLPPSPWKALL